MPYKALEIVDEALSFMERTCNRLFLAEAHRLKGACLDAMGGDQILDAESWFSQAVNIADEQKAMSLKLRAATALAQHRRSFGQPAGTFSTLKETYDWFTEGFSTPDLQDARRLLSS